MKAECPYLLDRRSRGLPDADTIPPSPEDLWAHDAGKKALGGQSKDSLKQLWRTHRGLLPRGLLPNDHALCAESLPSPYAGEARVADDLDFALRLTAQLGPDMRAWRNEQMAKFRRYGTAFQLMRPSLEKGRGSASARVSSHVRLERLLLSTYAIAWPDTGLTSMVQKGATVAGTIPHAGIYRATSVLPTVPRSELFSTADSWVDEVCRRPPPKPDQQAVIWSKSSDEVEAGLLEKFCTRQQMDAKWGKGGWRPLYASL